MQNPSILKQQIIKDFLSSGMQNSVYPHSKLGLPVPSGYEGNKNFLRDVYKNKDLRNELGSAATSEDKNRLENEFDDIDKDNDEEAENSDMSEQNPDETGNKFNKEQDEDEKPSADEKDNNEQEDQDNSSEEAGYDNDEQPEEGSSNKSNGPEGAPEETAKGAGKMAETEKVATGARSAAAAAGETAAVGETAVAAGGAAAAAEGTAGAAAGAAFISGSPIAIPIIIVGIIIIIVVTIAVSVQYLGKNDHVDISQTGDRGNIAYALGNNNLESLKKLLNENIDSFIAKIEKIKALQQTQSKPNEEVTNLCEQIISKAKELKDKNKEIKLLDTNPNSADREPVAKLKGEAEKLNIEVIDLLKKLVPLIKNPIDIALLELGVCEGTPSFHNKPYNINDAWCASFVKHVYQQAGLSIPNIDLAPGLYCEMQKDPSKYITFEAGKGTPQPGDLVFFGWGSIDNRYCNTEIAHVGIVYKVNSNTEITTIEGNTSVSGFSTDCVGTKTRNISTKFGASGARYFARVK